MAASVGGVIVRAAMARGADPDELRRITGFDASVAVDPDARISLAIETKLWQEAARVCGDDALGLHAAELLQTGQFDAMEYAIRSAPTFAAAIARLVRYNRLVHDAALYTLRRFDDRARIEHAFHSTTAVQSRHSAEFTVASWVVIGGQILGAPLRATSVEFRTPAPVSVGTLAEHRRIFGVTPQFAGPVNALEFAASELERPLVSADPSLSRVVSRHADALLAALPAPAERVSGRVRRAIVDMLGKDGASLAQVATRLHSTERSLQRHLAEEGSNFEQLLDDTRRELALRYLGERKLAIGEVAYLLGYSETSAFHRAFKRWTGMTPSQSRASS